MNPVEDLSNYGQDLALENVSFVLKMNARVFCGLLVSRVNIDWRFLVREEIR